MAHVDKEIRRTLSLFEEARRENPSELKIVLTGMFYRFNLLYESVLSTMMEVDYKSCIKFMLDHASDIDALEIGGSTIITNKYSSTNIEITETSFHQNNATKSRCLIFVIKDVNFSNAHKWMFICSAIGNALSYKFGEDYIIDIYLIDPYIYVHDLNNMSGLKLKQTEIPQMTINSDCRYKNISEMKVDDFEIWNYFYDGVDA